MAQKSKPEFYNNMELGTQKFLDFLASLNGPQIYEMSVQDARQFLLKAQSGNVKLMLADVEERTIPCRPTGKLSITIIRPKNVSGPLPVVMYFHGGGWVLGNRQTHNRLMHELAHGAKAAVVYVGYDPSPEVKYPVPTEQLYAATKYISEHGKSFNLDPSRLAIAGDSVGGNMAAVVSLLAKERNGPHIDFQLLFYPVTDASFDTPSYKQFATDCYLTLEAMKWFWNAYIPDDPKLRRQHTVSPLQATPEQLKGLPPALIITGECDVLRDEGERYAHKLMQAGVTVTAMRCLGIIHDFVMLDALADTNAAKAAMVQATTALYKALHM